MIDLRPATDPVPPPAPPPGAVASPPSAVPPSAVPAHLLRRVLPGMVARGHGVEGLCAHLGLDRASLLDLVVDLDLPTPHDRPVRRPGGRNPWQASDTADLLVLWMGGWHAESLGERFGRSAEAVYRKAHRLGLPRRDRHRVFRPPEPAPPPPAPSRAKRAHSEWTRERDRDLARRWWARQHYKAIGREMGVSPKAVQDRRMRLELPAAQDLPPALRPTVERFDPAAVEANIAAAGYRERTCSALASDGKVFWFWTPRRGGRITCREVERLRAKRAARLRPLFPGPMPAPSRARDGIARPAEVPA